jgi:hypothetical protein
LGTKTTDRGLIRPQRLTRLKRLGVLHTKVTEQGVASLRQVLPGARVARTEDDAVREAEGGDEDE